jgi:hypothetical protein
MSENSFKRLDSFIDKTGNLVYIINIVEDTLFLSSWRKTGERTLVGNSIRDRFNWTETVDEFLSHKRKRC